MTKKCMSCNRIIKENEYEFCEDCLFLTWKNRIDYHQLKWTPKAPTVRGKYFFWNKRTDSTELYRVSTHTDHRDGIYKLCWESEGARTYKPPIGLWSCYVCLPEPTKKQKKELINILGGTE